MNRGPAVEEAVQRALRAQDARISAIRVLAEARQGSTDARDEGARELAELHERIAQRVSAADAADLRAHRAALNAGWTPEELRKIGFAAPEKTRTTTRRRARRGSSSEGEAATQPAGPPTTSSARAGVPSPTRTETADA